MRLKKWNKMNIMNMDEMFKCINRKYKNIINISYHCFAQGNRFFPSKYQIQSLVIEIDYSCVSILLENHINAVCISRRPIIVLLFHLNDMNFIDLKIDNRVAIVAKQVI